jgi:ABC-type glycerol-3-phosphate transport system substrate-binding protein
MSKKSLRLAALGVLTMTGTAALAQEVTLNVWSDTPRLPTFAAYDAARENVALNVTTVAPEDLLAKLQLAMQAGSDMPDVIFMSDIAFTAQLSTRTSNYLMELTDLVPQATLDEFYPNSNSPCYVNGRLLCLRNDMAHFHIWYDTARMAELGQAVPTTWEEFRALGAALGPQGYILGSGTEPYPLINYLRSGGCPLAVPVDGAEDTLQIDLTQPACIMAAEMVDEMVANGSLTKTSPFDPSFAELATAGRLPLVIGPTWFGEYVIKPTYAFPEGVLAAAPPLRWADQAAPLTWSWGGGTYGAWRDTPHPDEAVDLVIWAASDVGNQTNAVTLPAHAPSAVAWGARLQADAYYANDQVFAVEVAAAEFSDPAYVSLRFSIPEAVSKTVSAAILGGGTAVDALPALQEELVNQAQLNGYTVQ